MTSSKRSTKALTIGRQSKGEWLQTTPGERFIIRTSVEERKEMSALGPVFS
jgi:hypothetical protein